MVGQQTPGKNFYRGILPQVPHDILSKPMKIPVAKKELLLVPSTIVDVVVFARLQCSRGYQDYFIFFENPSQICSL